MNYNHILTYKEKVKSMQLRSVDNHIKGNKVNKKEMKIL